MYTLKSLILISLQLQIFCLLFKISDYFGQKGTGDGEFQLPAGLQIDNKDRIYVVDSFNRRVQIFHYYGIAQAAEGRKQ